MPRIRLLAGAVALAITGSAAAAQFDAVVVFGDSLSDNGNLSYAEELPFAPTRFTTNRAGSDRTRIGLLRYCVDAFAPRRHRLRFRRRRPDQQRARYAAHGSIAFAAVADVSRRHWRQGGSQRAVCD